MALFMKQDFNPPLLSRKWIAMKFRPNMLIYSRDNIIAILESGLLFREDSVEVELEVPDVETAWKRAGGTKGGWFTTGERNVALLATTALLLAAPPRNIERGTLLRLTSLALVPLATRATLRWRCRGRLYSLVAVMRDYTALARRAAACCREYVALHARLGSVLSAVESTLAMLSRQQTELLILMSRASSAVLGNVPWLRGDVSYEYNTDSLIKIHHAFLVVQSSLLKHIALAHHMPTFHTSKLYKNHNERIYWIHNVLINYLIQEFKENYEALERMYRLLKNYGTKDSDSALKKPGAALNDTWLYSDVHTGIARSCLELKLTLDKCNDLDMFLDSCALNKQELDLNVLDKDIDEIIDNITKCLTAVQNSQIRLKKMVNKVCVEEDKQPIEEEIQDTAIIKIDDKEPEIRDEVFYFVKTEDESVNTPGGDIITGPGKKEKENSKVVLKELKRKLVKREDLMRERERQALAKTMPELKIIPEFPRQIPLEFVDRKGFISKLKGHKFPKKVFKEYRISKNNKKKRKFNIFQIKIEKYDNDYDIPQNYIEANGHLDIKSRFLTINGTKNGLNIIKWCKLVRTINNDLNISDVSEGLSDVEINAENRNINQALNLNREENRIKDFKFSKKDLELSPSSSESDFEYFYNKKVALLNDVRRHRAVRKKNHPIHRSSADNVDESLKPIEYSFGTGMAMASVLQVNNKARLPNMLQEEIFIGDGEVSNDSGNDEDA